MPVIQFRTPEVKCRNAYADDLTGVLLDVNRRNVMIFAVLRPFFKSSAEVEGFVATMDEQEYLTVLGKAKELLALDLSEMSRGEQFLVEAQLHFLHQALQSYTDRVMNNLDCTE